MFCLYTAKKRLLFWQLQLLLELQLLTRMSLVAASNGQYTHGVQEQLKLLQGLGSLLSHQISAIHNKGIVPLQRSSTHTYLTCLNHNEWLPWLQTTWRDSGSGCFTLGLETNSIKQLERKLVQIRAALPTLPIDGCHKGLTLHHPLKPCHSCNSGNKCDCQYNKSFFSVYLAMQLYYTLFLDSVHYRLQLHIYSRNVYGMMNVASRMAHNFLKLEEFSVVPIQLTTIAWLLTWFGY